MKETFGKPQTFVNRNVSFEKNGLKKSLVIAKARFFKWLQSIIFIVHNLKAIQSVIDHQNREIEEQRLLVNFLLKNTNRYIRRRWIRYLDYAQEVGIWDTKIVKLCPSDKFPIHSEKEFIDEICSKIPE
jgi:hypothetical protein